MSIKNNKKYVKATQTLGALKKGESYELVGSTGNRYKIMMDGWSVSYLKILFTY